MAQNLAGRSILITGGASGIGRAVALRSAEAGAAVTVTDVNVEAGTQVAAEVVSNGGQAQFVRLDVSDEAQHHAAVAAAVKAFGKLDGSCNAAGQPFKGKPIAIQSASQGPLGGARMQYHLRMCMTYLSCDIFGTPEIFVSMAQNKFDKDTLKLTDEPTRKIVAQQLEAFAKYIERVKA